jgi:hypothetical protein
MPHVQAPGGAEDVRVVVDLPQSDERVFVELEVDEPEPGGLVGPRLVSLAPFLYP